jgi:tetratricopeptide (TPR) repeat protein
MKHCIAALAVIALALPAVGDVVHLKNGGSLEGQVVKTDDGVIVKLPAGEVRISNEAVARIEEKPSQLDEYQKRLAGTKEDDAEAHYRLGAWAQSVGLRPQAKEEFEKTVALDPNHAKAHEALGHRLVDGRWMSHDDEMKARGLVKHEGQWMTPEAAGKLQALKAELELARERRKAAEAELKKAQEEIRTEVPAEPATMPIYTPNPYDYYYSTRHLRAPYTYYYTPRYVVPYYRYGGWYYYPGGYRSISPARRYYRYRHR